MIEFSLGKLVLLALIALIVLGPEKLPGAARTAGALLRRVRSGWDNVRAEVERELEVEEIRKAAREAAGHAESVQKDLQGTFEQVRQSLPQNLMTGPSAPPESVVPAGTAVNDEAVDSRQTELPLGPPVSLPPLQEHSHGRS